MNETEFRTDDFDASTLQYLGKYEMGVLLGLCAPLCYLLRLFPFFLN